MSAPTRSTPIRPGPVEWLGVVALTVSGGLSAWLESLFVPYYVGSVVVPVTVLFAMAGNWYLPRLARRLVPNTLVACLPFLAWLAVVVFVSAAGRPEGDVILPGGGTAVQYVGYAFILGGALVATISLVLDLPPPQRRPQGAAGPGSTR